MNSTVVLRSVLHGCTCDLPCTWSERGEKGVGVGAAQLSCVHPLLLCVIADTMSVRSHAQHRSSGYLSLALILEWLKKNNQIPLYVMKMIYVTCHFDPEIFLLGRFCGKLPINQNWQSGNWVSSARYLWRFTLQITGQNNSLFSLCLLSE